MPRREEIALGLRPTQDWEHDKGEPRNKSRLANSRPDSVSMPRMSNNDSERTRTVTWEDPRPLAEAGRTATAEGRVVDESGKLYAHGTTTCLILRP